MDSDAGFQQSKISASQVYIHTNECSSWKLTKDTSETIESIEKIFFKKNQLFKKQGGTRVDLLLGRLQIPDCNQEPGSISDLRRSWSWPKSRVTKDN